VSRTSISMNITSDSSDEPAIVMTEIIGIKEDDAFDAILAALEGQLLTRIKPIIADAMPLGSTEVIDALAAQQVRLEMLDRLVHLPLGMAAGISMDL
jgi:hypothetical protein